MVRPLYRAYEATETIHSYCYLAFGVSFYKDNFNLIPEKLVEGRNEQGNLDYAVECRPTGRILGVIEVKKENFMKGFTGVRADGINFVTDRCVQRQEFATGPRTYCMAVRRGSKTGGSSQSNRGFHSPYAWLKTLKEEWQKELIEETEGIFIPYGTDGKLITPPGLQPIHMITIWDVVCLLWKYYIRRRQKKSNTSLSYQDAKTLIKNNYDDGRGCGGSPIDDQRHIFNTNKEDHKKCTKKKKKKSRKEEKNTEKEVCEPVYARNVTPLRKGTDETRGSANIPYQQNSIGEESGNDAYTLSNAPITEEYAGCSQAWGNCSELVP
ncbi:hypothetical protein C1646_753428 [Rhizophagus diaphanus]|nr:hypothetical protein C1646_753428 [Rhizophagus diaphanus] [Rhizophagus sp. MUCL 43196]